MKHEPQTEDEWIVHALNIQGVLFERKCQQVVSQARGIELKSSNYPVEFPPQGGKESSLDMWAELKHDRKLLNLLIECVDCQEI